MIMMKLNNKGMTLMELLISIVLIGIVLTFLFSLLNDLQFETNNNNYAYYNQVNRIDTIYTIEKDLQNYTLVGIEDASVEGKITIKFHYLKGSETDTAILESDAHEYRDALGVTKTKYYLRYTNVNDEKFSWEMKGAELDPCATFNYYIDNSSNSYYFKINIPLYNNVFNPKNNKDKNNFVDDIEIIYAGDKNNLNTTNQSYLTGNSIVEKQIKSCTN